MIDGGLVMEEDEDVVEGGAEFVGEDFELDIVVDHWENVLFCHDEAFPGQPDDAVVELHGFGVPRGVEFAVASGADEVFGEDDGEAEDFVKEGGEKGAGILRAFGEAAKKLLVHLRRGHQTVHVQATGDLEESHC